MWINNNAELCIRYTDDSTGWDIASSPDTRYLLVEKERELRKIYWLVLELYFDQRITP